ncbi:Uncharacterised protein [Mycobacteroides abscessus subsp. abscessus]|nr:Uncharacterised protein [Mycobacteroides abscessus subsp. abscessus]
MVAPRDSFVEVSHVAVRVGPGQAVGFFLRQTFHALVGLEVVLDPDYLSGIIDPAERV